MKSSQTNATFHWGNAREVRPQRRDWLLIVVDICLAAVLCVAPFIFGGRHDLGRLVMLSLIAVAAVAWSARQCLRSTSEFPRTNAYFIFLAAAALLVAQIVPLPFDWVVRLSPNLPKLLPLWTGEHEAGLSLGQWNRLSLVPHETTKSLAMLIGYALLFIVTAGRIRKVEDIRRILSFLAIAAVCMAAFGVAQYWTSDGRFFWFYEHSHRSATTSLSGAFINRNHFAHFLTLGAGPLAACLFAMLYNRSVTRNTAPAKVALQKLLVWLTFGALIFVVLTAIASRSRGGVIALLAASIALVAVYRAAGLIDRRVIYSICGLGAIVAGVLAWGGYDRVLTRLGNLTEGSLEQVDQDGVRRMIWAANLQAFKAFPLTGAGAGSHREICPVYLDTTQADEYTHAENGYLQILTENGLLGGLLLTAGIFCVVGWCTRCFVRLSQSEESLWFGAACAGLAVSLVHSVVDFVWYIPACMSATVVLAACVLRLSQLMRNTTGLSGSGWVFTHARWLELTAAMLLVSGWSVYAFVGPGMAAVYWDQYLRASVANTELANEALTQFVSDQSVGAKDKRRHMLQKSIEHLCNVVKWDPQLARAHRRLADRYVAEYELNAELSDQSTNVLNVVQIREAVLNSTFSSVEELKAWLAKAFGQEIDRLNLAQSHAHRAVALCPLQGDSYLTLGELTFLDLEPTSVVQAYMDQALVVRPHDRNVLNKVGRYEASRGRLDAAVLHWKKCFPIPGRHQKEIIYLMASSGVPARAFLEMFSPTWQTLREVWDQYRRVGDPEQLTEIVSYARAQTIKESQAKPARSVCYLWYWQSEMYKQIDRPIEALTCLQRAYACDPTIFFVRCGLARGLKANGQFVEAESHARWCLARRPNDTALRAMLEEISKSRLATQATNITNNRWKPRIAFAKPLVSSIAQEPQGNR